MLLSLSPARALLAPLLAALTVGTTVPLATRSAGESRAPHPSPRTQVITIVAREYAFEAPDTVSAGRTEVQLLNRGTELHHAYLVRLDAGHTLTDLFAAVGQSGKLPSWAHDAGGPNAPVPGGASAAVVDLVPGTYALLCVIPAADGMPHAMKGMAHTLTVVSGGRASGASTSAVPLVDTSPDVTISLSDYAFALSKPLTPGHHIVRVENTASQSHEAFIARLAPGKTPSDALAWIEKPQGPPPLTPLGGTVGLAHGVSNDIALDITPGNYALFCFIPDAKDGKPHVMHGMIREFSVR